MSPIKRFSVISLSIIFVIGLILSYGVSRFIHAQMVSLATYTIGGHTMNLLEEGFADLLQDGSTQPDLQKLSGAFLHSLRKEIKLLKLWDREGKIIYSNVEELIGKQFPVGENLREALSGKIVGELSDLEEEENAFEKSQYDHLLEIYIPVKEPNSQRILGAYEIYWDAAAPVEAISKTYYFVWSILSAGFIFLYLTLYKVFKAATHKIKESESYIFSLTQHLNTTELEKQKAYLGSIQALLAALDAKDNYTAGHSLRVAKYAVDLGKALDLSAERRALLEEAAIFHDIGKISISDALLNKPGSLTDEEFRRIKEHPAVGANIVQASGVFLEQAQILRHHHERWDGQGYPEGLCKEEIPLESRILAVADTYDALTSDRPYRTGKSTEEAVEILKQVRGTQLEEKLVNVFISAVINLIPEDGIHKKSESRS